ncbi:G1 family glutamic endopeptidase [Nocardia sp. GCM10030253]|uniref:G1 family glutamic endopeptidase n=1 Tax=Nocardia sp. GCM10030253 TaxID=3273404 RepID=UPI003634A63E
MEPELIPADTPTEPVTGEASFGLSQRDDCGYTLFSTEPFVELFATWTIPNLNHRPTSMEPNHFHTFLGLGFLDVHVEMTVDPAQNVTAQIQIHNGTQVALPVSPGDAITATLCLQTNSAGTAAYFLANETTSQTMNFQMDTGFPPAVTIDAGISRSQLNAPFNPLARFGVVYFDEIIAFTTNGTRSLTSGTPITMVDSDGSTLARPVRLTENAFKTVYEGD